MKAMILAAGRGERMRPLTDKTPKPLLKIGGKSLIEYHLERLAAMGMQEVVINISYRGEQIRQALGSGERWQLTIHYSVEPEPLETAGAIMQALPLLGEQPFLLISGDVWTDYPLAQLREKNLGDKQGHLVLVNNPEHHREGDFSVDGALLTQKTVPSFTYSGISVLAPGLVSNYFMARKKFPLGEVLRNSLEARMLTAEIYQGQWSDIGTVGRLQALNEEVSRAV
ncbi:MAG: nucleotidyltransferase family protein [Cellvibrionaceae bacterium]|nr:nucleotidyltransferase family protein [Cellvibrionaceae bacterium]